LHDQAGRLRGSDRSRWHRLGGNARQHHWLVAFALSGRFQRRRCPCTPVPARKDWPGLTPRGWLLVRRETESERLERIRATLEAARRNLEKRPAAASTPPKPKQKKRKRRRTE